jgi:hypothetical protein
MDASVDSLDRAACSRMLCRLRIHGLRTHPLSRGTQCRGGEGAMHALPRIFALIELLVFCTFTFITNDGSTPWNTALSVALL